VWLRVAGMQDFFFKKLTFIIFQTSNNIEQHKEPTKQPEELNLNHNKQLQQLIYNLRLSGTSFVHTVIALFEAFSSLDQ